jgi:hypothetical protein
MVGRLIVISPRSDGQRGSSGTQKPFSETYSSRSSATLARTATAARVERALGANETTVISSG